MIPVENEATAIDSLEEDVRRLLYFSSFVPQSGAMLWLPFERGKPEILRQPISLETFTGLADLIVIDKYP